MALSIQVDRDTLESALLLMRNVGAQTLKLTALTRQGPIYELLVDTDVNALKGGAHVTVVGLVSADFLAGAMMVSYQTMRDLLDGLPSSAPTVILAAATKDELKAGQVQAASSLLATIGTYAPAAVVGVAYAGSSAWLFSASITSVDP